MRSAPRLAIFLSVFGAACAGSGIVVGGPGMQVGIPVRRTAAAYGDTVVDRLYFGRSMRHGGEVGDSAWAAFVRDVVIPRFAGLTVYSAEGRWRDENGGVAGERTFVLEIVHPTGPASEADLREIAAEYKRRFDQSSVLRATTPARMQEYE
jgi:hypothetical protein